MSWALSCLLSAGLLASPEIQGVKFPLGTRCVPGRWFPVGISLRSLLRDWEGAIVIQTEEAGPIFERSIRIQKGEERVFLVPILFRAFPSQLAVEVGYNRARFEGPPRATSPTWLLVGPRPAEARKILAGDPSLPQASLAEAVELGVEQLPQDLYALDGTDFLFLQEEAVDALPPASKDLLLRWASLRGRLLTTEEGKRRFGADARLDRLLEVPGSTLWRRLPRQELPPDPCPALLPKDFVGAGDFAALGLFLYLVVCLLHLLKAAPFRKVSNLSLEAGLACLLLVLPGVGWPREAPPWRTVIGHEESPTLLVEDRCHGAWETLVLDPTQALLLPGPGARFIAEWGNSLRFLRIEGETKVHSGALLAERGFERAAGGRFRNRIAPMEDVCWSAGAMASVGFRERLAFGDLLETGGEVPLPGRRLPRPIADFLAAEWISGDWVLGRVAGEDPAADWNPLGRRPAKVFFLWFPRPLK